MKLSFTTLHSILKIYYIQFVISFSTWYVKILNVAVWILVGVISKYHNAPTFALYLEYYKFKNLEK